MVYSNDFVVCILVDGKPLEERTDNCVPIPFGSEYTIRLRNKNAKRAVARVFIDNENVSRGGIVVPANGYEDLETNVLKPGRKFKFVASDSPQAEDAGKTPDKDSNGVIRVEWQLERERQIRKEYVPLPYPVYTPPCPRLYDPWQPRLYAGGTSGQSVYPMSFNAGYGSASASSFAPDDFGGGKLRAADLSEGCTVQGSQSDQTFNTVSLELESNTTVITLVLRGFNADTPASVLPDNKYCKNCGAKRVARAKFCGNCGKALTASRKRV